MRALILRFLGWKRFKHSKVTIFQKASLVDQTLIASAIDETAKFRQWCKSDQITIIVEDSDFSGLYERRVRSEVVRFTGGWFTKRSATLRVVHSLITHNRLVELLREVGRVDKV